MTLGNNLNDTYINYAPWTNPSDRKLKKEIQPLSYGLEFIKKLTPSSYIMKSRKDQKRDYGFIAQEVQAVLKSYNDQDSNMLTTIDQTEGTLGLKYTNLIPILAKAIQELSEENEELKAQNKQILEHLKILEIKK